MTVSLPRPAGLPLDRDRWIWIIVDSNFRWLLHSFACDLVDTERYKVLLIVPGEGSIKLHRDYLGQPFHGEIALGPQNPPLFAKPRTPAEKAATLAAARQIEAEHGVRLMREFVQLDRYLGRAFLSGARGYPESGVSRAATEDYVLHTCVTAFATVKALFDRYPPSLCLGFGIAASRTTVPIQRLLATAGIPLRSISSTRIGGLYHWADDLYEGSARFRRQFAQAVVREEREVSDLLTAVQPNYANEAKHYKDTWANALRWPVVARRVAGVWIRRAREHLAGSSNASLGVTAPGVSAMYIRTRVHRDRLARLCRDWKPKLEGREFVFFPLQAEPETSLHSFSPECSDQYHTIREFALSLPAGYVLAVKEHKWAVGLRHWSFYESIAALPNVVFVDMAVDGIDLVRRCCAVATITSSAGHEAALLGKPVIRFGRRGALPMLDHVHVVRDVDDLQALPRLLVQDEQQKQEARLQGARFVKALQAIAFDLSQHDVISRPRVADRPLLDLLKSTLAEALVQETEAFDLATQSNAL